VRLEFKLANCSKCRRGEQHSASGANHHCVQVCGDFNNWEPSQGLATCSAPRDAEENEYIVDVWLAPGSYNFYFIVDGEQRCSDAYNFAEGPMRDQIFNSIDISVLSALRAWRRRTAALLSIVMILDHSTDGAVIRAIQKTASQSSFSSLASSVSHSLSQAAAHARRFAHTVSQGLPCQMIMQSRSSRSEMRSSSESASSAPGASNAVQGRGDGLLGAALHSLLGSGGR